MIVLGITKKSATGEFRVFWQQDGRDQEWKSYYTDDPRDAVDTLVEVYKNVPKTHPTHVVKFSSNKLTQTLLRNYHWEYSEANSEESHAKLLMPNGNYRWDL